MALTDPADYEEQHASTSTETHNEDDVSGEGSGETTTTSGGGSSVIGVGLQIPTPQPTRRNTAASTVSTITPNSVPPNYTTLQQKEFEGSVREYVYPWVKYVMERDVVESCGLSRPFKCWLRNRCVDWSDDEEKAQLIRVWDTYARRLLSCVLRTRRSNACEAMKTKFKGK